MKKTTEQNQPTPTPQSNEQDKGYTPGNITHSFHNDYINIYSVTHGAIATIKHEGKHKTEHEANAVRIVECWNNYDGVVKRCEELLGVNILNEVLIDEAKAENEKLKADKKELLEALRQLAYYANGKLSYNSAEGVLANVKTLLNKHK